MRKKSKQEFIKIEGMTCGNCALGIKKHLDKNGVQNVSVNFASAEASFSTTQQHDFDNVKELIQALGFKVKEISNQDSVPKYSVLEKKFFFTLFFTIPLFSHMFLPKDSILHNALLQFVLCLPVFFVGCIHFGKSAYSSLKSGLPNMDVLILMGSSAAFFYSIYGWVLYNGNEQVHHFLFFETTATIITLVLLGNVLEDRSVRQTTTAIRELSAIKKGIAKKEVNNLIEEVSFDMIKVDDVLIVNAGDKIPVDGKVIWGSALIDESMLTGESIPINKVLEERVIGGTILKSGSIKIQATSIGNDMLISQIIELVRNAEENNIYIKPNEIFNEFELPQGNYRIQIDFLNQVSKGQLYEQDLEFPFWFEDFDINVAHADEPSYEEITMYILKKSGQKASFPTVETDDGIFLVGSDELILHYSEIYKTNRDNIKMLKYWEKNMMPRMRNVIKQLREANERIESLS